MDFGGQAGGNEVDCAQAEKVVGVAESGDAGVESEHSEDNGLVAQR
jgi:hypothetical protein